MPARDSRRTRACYIHPLWGLDGEVLTDDFPDDHYHHHGIFWAWPYVGVNGKEYDMWTSDAVTPKFVRWISREASPEAAVLGVENGWFIGDGKVMIERLRIRAHKAADGMRAIDLEFEWTPVDAPVSLRGRGGKSYGGLTVRFQNLPRQDVTITVPSGRTTGDLKNTPLEWVDFTAKYPGRKEPSGGGSRGPASVKVVAVAGCCGQRIGQLHVFVDDQEFDEHIETTLTLDGCCRAV